MQVPADLGRVLLDVFSLGARYDTKHNEERMLVVQPRADGYVVAAWALCTHITRHDVWTRAPNMPRALELLRNALETS